MLDAVDDDDDGDVSPTGLMIFQVNFRDGLQQFSRRCE